MSKKPKILSTEIIGEGKLFKIEKVHLQFSNGAERYYERLQGAKRSSVMIMPMLNDDEFILVREYAVGSKRYELTLPKGLCDDGEDFLETANRELQEEAGYGAKKLQLVKKLTAIPGYLCGSMQIVLAQELYPATLPGDEPEPLEVITWRLSELDQLIQRDDFTEGRTIAAIYIVKDLLNKQKSNKQ